MGYQRREFAIFLLVVFCGLGIIFVANIPRRDKLRADTCTTNLRILGRALQQYANDNDGYYPHAWFGRDAGPSDAKSNSKWMDVVYPYVKSTKYFQCASDTVSSPYRFRSGTNYGSYIINNAYSRDDDTYTPPAGVPLSAIQQPSLCILLTHGDGNFQAEWPGPESTPPLTSDAYDRMGEVVYRHPGGKGCTLFSDGHSGYNRLEVEAQIKTINGHKIATSFTIQQD
jgi:hypothetical protein